MLAGEQNVNKWRNQWKYVVFSHLRACWKFMGKVMYLEVKSFKYMVLYVLAINHVIELKFRDAQGIVPVGRNLQGSLMHGEFLMSNSIEQGCSTTS